MKTARHIECKTLKKEGQWKAVPSEILVKIYMNSLELCSLNRRNELASSRPQRNRYVLQNSRVT